jgi:hypothetical protein
MGTAMRTFTGTRAFTRTATAKCKVYTLAYS